MIKNYLKKRNQNEVEVALNVVGMLEVYLVAEFFLKRTDICKIHSDDRPNVRAILTFLPSGAEKKLDFQFRQI